MSYAYSARNLLVESHHYMYAPFEGRPLLDAFFRARREIMRQLDAASGVASADRELVIPVARLIDRQLALCCPSTHELWRNELGETAILAQGSGEKLPLAVTRTSIATFSIDNTVTTTMLLEALLADIASGNAGSGSSAQMTAEWLDRLIQRFEVTKRLYESYQPGFRNGLGEYQSLRRYWLFALILVLSLSQGQGLKNLNALLKVCDLLCSMGAEELIDSVPAGGMQIVLASELASIGTVMETKGLLNAAA